jgi:hypothetical protein
MTVQIVTTEAGSAAMPNPSSCCWCDRPFQLRQSGGRAQRFCSPHCRLAFHAAARRWTLDAIEAGVLSIGDIKRSAEPTRTLLQTMPAPAAMPTCSPAAAGDAQLPHKPADGPLASSRAAAPFIDKMIERIAGGGKATTQIKQQIASAEWAVKRDSAASRPQRHGAESAAAQRLAREWGGEHEVRTHYGTAAAKIILDRLGPGQLAKLLAFADKVDPAEIINHLRASVAARAAKAS